mgnify:CR=1 FL=1
MDIGTKKKLSSKWILEFYKELEKYDIENHGLLIMQGDDVVFEEYAYPYSHDMPHTLFSVTKSLVSTAVGFAIDEGLFSLDTKILPLFPEYKACKCDAWEKLTVRSLLTMQSNKEFTFLQDMTGNYVEMFMKAPFRKKQGFLYSNNDVHVLSALIQKLSGMPVVDYLTPRLFQPLGIEKPFWETNSIGECIGGTGAYLKLYDLAKICRCYADGGRFKGEQIIPQWWTREATRMQVVFNEKEPDKGYGYLFWIENGIFSMTGMFGQIISYCPQYDAVIATMNSCIKEGDNERLLKSVLLNAFAEKSDDEWDEKLSCYLKERGEKPLPCTERLNIPTGQAFYLTHFSNLLAKIMFPASLIPRSITSSFAKRPKSNLNKLSFEKSESVLTVKWFEEDDEIVIKSGLDGVPRFSESSIKGYPYKVWSYTYCEKGKLQMVVKPLNTLATQYITLDFNKNVVNLQIKGTPSFTEFIMKNAGTVPIFKKAPFSSVLKWLLSLTERPMKFKTK